MEFDERKAARDALRPKLERWAAGKRVTFTAEERATIRELVCSAHAVELDAWAELGQGYAQRLDEVGEEYERERGRSGKNADRARRRLAERLGLEPEGGKRRPGFDLDAAGVTARRAMRSYAPREHQLVPDPAVEQLVRKGHSLAQARRMLWGKAIREVAKEQNLAESTVLEGLQDYRARVRREAQSMQGWKRRKALEILEGLEGLPTTLNL